MYDQWTTSPPPTKIGLKSPIMQMYLRVYEQLLILIFKLLNNQCMCVAISMNNQWMHYMYVCMINEPHVCMYVLYSLDITLPLLPIRFSYKYGGGGL